LTIADERAVRELVSKMLRWGSRQKRRERLMKAVQDASRHYKSSSREERQAFFHGLLTGYAVALKLL
jgi:hypothetical protein